MFKKGFTLAELIGVIVILGLIALVAIPSILNAINSQKDEISDASKEIIYNATNLYIRDNSNNFPKFNGNTFCLTLDKLTQGDYLPDTIYDAVSGDEVPLTNIVEVKYEQDRFSYNLNNECVEKIEVMPNEPVLATNMIPIKYNGTNWVYADTNEEWYNYINKQWANAVVLNSGVTKNVGDTISEDEIALWYVWIPRYKYQLFNANNGSVSEQLINIRFETGTSSTGTVSCVDAINQTDSEGNLISEICTNANNGNWYTHPAFTFGNEELTGFWIGKFEVSTTDETCNGESNTTNCNKVLPVTIKAGITSFRNVDNYNMFESIKAINSTYSLSGDSHMMKNTEWGAVSYLKQSAYGLGTTDIAINDSSYITGGGTGTAYKDNIAQSTTGNIYGVYDMSGGTWERVMGNMVDSTGALYSSNSGFSNTLEEKYYDKYTNDTVNTTYSRGKIGDATKETRNWYSDYANFVYSINSWFSRGGTYDNGTGAGGFSFTYNDGRAKVYVGSRAVLAP